MANRCRGPNRGCNHAQLFLRTAVLVLWLGTIPPIAAQSGSTASQTAGPPAVTTLPFRFELGGYYTWADNGYGNWRGVDAALWYRGNSRFVPAFLVDSQTRPAGTQQNYAFTSYMNWKPSFYTVQSFSAAPQNSPQAIYFPKGRFDVKGYWKLPPDRNLVLGAGFTHYDFGQPGYGEIYNIGALYYRKKLVIEGNLFINQSFPGNLWSASGSAALQYGTEGKYWFGLLASGGRELYYYSGLSPGNVRLTSITVNLFYRRWISRHIGYVVGTLLEDKLDAYLRGGASARLFFEF
jgi:YaiO family outer membrane protein